MLPALPHAWQGLPLILRFGAWTVLWTIGFLLLQFILELCVHIAKQLGLKQSSRNPSVPWQTMLWEDVVGFSAWVAPMALFAAWANPSWSSWSYSMPNLIVLGYWALVTLMAYDTYSFFLHRWLHTNKTVFLMLHAKHHATSASLNVTSSGYMTVSEGLLSAGIPFLALYAAGWATGSWWYCLAGIYNSLYIVIMGHCGCDLQLGDLRNVGFAVLNPFVLWYLGVPCHAEPMDHEHHHTDPRTNYAFFFTWWDDLHGTSKTKNQPRCSFTVLAANAVFQALFWSSVQLFWWYPLHMVAVYVVAYVLVPPATASAAADALGLPELAMGLFGGLADRYREDSAIACVSTMVEPKEATITTEVLATGPAELGSGEPGHIEQEQAQEHQLQSKHQVLQQQCQQQLTEQPVYVFACHPTGLLSRGAFCTFAARGWQSPVSGIARVRLAIGDILFSLPIPLVREFLLAAGCCPADATTLKRQLRSGTSIAITPGGWQEAQNVGSYNLVLHKRKGFVALAAETGAQLVPVLCLGEQELVGEAGFGFQVVKFLISARPMPIQVVLGEPVALKEGESVEQLHARYVAALLSLGKQHGVKLSVVE